jgi:hypothetical protein
MNTDPPTAIDVTTHRAAKDATFAILLTGAAFLVAGIAYLASLVGGR